jgi:hypothetical protein
MDAAERLFILETFLAQLSKVHMRTLLTIAVGIVSATAPALASQPPRPAIGALPLNFEPNRGQAEPTAQFLARGAGYYLTLNAKGSHVVLRKGEKAAQIDTRLVGANGSSELKALELLPGQSSWFRGNDPAKWITGIPTYSRVKANSVYPGIDLVYYGNQSRLEYDFVVAPGADPAKIRMAFTGATGLHTDSVGNLIVSTPAGELRQEKPIVYQTAGGVRKPVDGVFVIAGRTVSFRIGRYDRSQALTIDPVLVYSSFLGGNGDDEGHSVAADGASNMYMTGVTFSTPAGDGDVLLRKISADGTTFIYIADLGGSDDDIANGVAVDVNGYVYVGGKTYSTDFPTAGANVFQSTNNDQGYAAFVLRIDPAFSTMIYSTYVGGSNDDQGFALAIDNQGNAYLTGAASSSDFPISQNAYQQSLLGNYNCFVFKIDNQGQRIYATFIGGGSDDEAFGIAVDNNGNAYITGETNSDSYPTANAPFQHSRHGGYDAFITELNASGSGLVFSTFAGGSADDAGNGIAVDSSGNIYVAGTTGSNDFPGTGSSFQSGYQGGTSDAFVIKYLPNGSNIAWATYLGSHGTDEGQAIAVDVNGNIYIAGDTNSDQFPITGDAIQSGRGGGFDATLSVMDTNGTTLYFSTFFGGQGDDAFFSVALDPYYNVYLTGQTSSADFPILSAVQPLSGGGSSDALLVKFDLTTSSIPGAAVATGPVTTTNANPPSATVSAFGRGMAAPQVAGKFHSKAIRTGGAQASPDSAATENAPRTTMKPNR